MRAYTVGDILQQLGYFLELLDDHNRIASKRMQNTLGAGRAESVCL